ncbi:MAG: transcriptional repressor NrdR [Neisseriaceae bacterium]|nr:transcriptional repressor NrdR [Neisseriaceae bacterium]
MKCPFCGNKETQVIDTRTAIDAFSIRRRRQCGQCGRRFSTEEKAEFQLPVIVKKHGEREVFDENKLRRGLKNALRKRPISAEQVDNIIDLVKQSLLLSEEKEISSQKVGELVMLHLRRLDQVAYVRFASVYERFNDVAEFTRIIADLSDEPECDEVRNEI